MNASFEGRSWFVYKKGKSVVIDLLYLLLAQALDGSTAASVRAIRDVGEKFTRILVPVDGSKCAERALNMAVRMAKNDGAELTILNATVVSTAFYSGEGGQLVEVAEERQKRAGEEILAFAAAEAGRRGIEPKTALLGAIESPASAIVAYAEKNKIDLIVIGTRGFKGLRRLISASVTSEVVCDAPCPVLVVR